MVGAVRGVAEVLAPRRCPACRARTGGPVWCPACTARVPPPPRPACARCGGPAVAGHGCWPSDAPIGSTRVAGDYRGVLAATIVAAKVGGARAAWPELGARLAAAVALDPPDVDLVTWVATPRARVRRRGVDHAAVLGTAVADRLGVAALRVLDAHRARGGERQTATRSLPGTRVLLVDDVLTTGATAAGAAWALLVAGAGAVDLAVLARAGGHPLVAGVRR